MKFKYSPGLIGYGPRGTDGSSGLPGMSIYFTDYDIFINKSYIETAIENNYVLWTTAEPNTLLTQGRKYNTGDLLMDTRGVIYEINKSTNTFTQTPGQLSKVEYFTTNNSRTSNGFERWFNFNSPTTSEGYLIDNLNIKNLVNFKYEDSSIYGIQEKNFTRIEGSDVSKNGYNTFTLYSSGENSNTDDHKSIALVYNQPENEFRLGNVDNSTGNIRNTCLTFDVSLLKHNRPFRFDKDTCSGYVITNREINVPLLFDPNFNPRPITFQNFYATSTLIRIKWDLQEFCLDPSISGDLHFYESVSSDTVYSLSDIRNNEIILHNVNNYASVWFTNLSTGKVYNYHMIIKKDGWERSSDKLSAYTGTSSYNIAVTDPASKHLIADASGWFTPGNTYIYDVDINANIPFGSWEAIPSHSWINLIPTTPTGSSGVYDFDVSLSRNTGTSSRTGYITLRAEGVTDNVITVDQTASLTTVSFNADGSIVFTPALSDQTVSLVLKLYASSIAKAGIFGYKYANTNVRIIRNGTVQASAEAEAISTGLVNVYDISSNHSIINLSSVDNVAVTVAGDEFADGPDCSYFSPTDYMEGLGWAKIVSATKTSGSGAINIGSDSYFYNKRVRTTCTLQKGVSSTEPISPTPI